MKRTSKYVALDVHQASTLASVREESGRVIARTILPTEAPPLVEFFRGIRGAVYVAVEEGTQAQWLHDLLVPLVHRVVVCDRRGQARQGNKGDQVDADQLSELLRRGGLRAVYHGSAHRTTLKELTRTYQQPPLTVADGYSRLLLACQALTSTKLVEARPIFERLFGEYGLPGRIRSDNGVPFATPALGRLSALAVWWIRLGILPDLTEPGSPHQNGRHERMHLTLKRECTRPPRSSRTQPQRCFDRWRQEYNTLRPHEALADATPASVYRPSPRPYPARLPPLEYPGHYEVRRVSRNGGIRWHKQWVNVSPDAGRGACRVRRDR